MLSENTLRRKLVVEASEAAIVRTIFSRYLELNSIGALAQDLDRAGVRTKQVKISQGRVRGGVRFGVGGLAHVLRNRF
jgi:hypothetical protein